MVSSPVVYVTQEDIDAAERNNSYHCVVANALARTFDAKRVLVDLQSMRMSLPHMGERRVYMTPIQVQSYIVDFDAGERIEPFSFKLGRPVWQGRIRSGQQGKVLGTSTLTMRTERTPHGREVKIPGTKPPALRPHGAYREYGLRTLRQNKG